MRTNEHNITRHELLKKFENKNWDKLPALVAAELSEMKGRGWEDQAAFELIDFAIRSTNRYEVVTPYMKSEEETP